MKTFRPWFRSASVIIHAGLVAIAVPIFPLAAIRAADAVPAMKQGTDDPFLWLEAIDDPKSLAWVKQHNDATAQRLGAQPGYEALYRDALGVLDSASRIPEVQQAGKYLYNLWKDREHPRGIYRRATPEEFAKANPQWETVIDIDALSVAEGKAWAFGGMTWLTPDCRLGLAHLSPGGGDAFEVREFDAEKRAFVPGGFVLPSAKSRIAWRDVDTLFVATDFGSGSMTTSGYPRVVKRWKRGTPITAATTLYEEAPASIGVSARRLQTKAGDIDLVSDSVTFWTSKHFQITGTGLKEIDLPPTSVVVDGFDGRLVIWLKEAWTTNGHSYVAGSVLLVATPSSTASTTQVEQVVAPTANEVVKQVSVTAQGILVAALDEVKGRLFRFTRTGQAGWKRETISFPDNGAVSIVSTDDESGDAWVQFESFTTPPTLYRVSAKETEAHAVKAQAPAFDGARFETKQYWTQSADGTKVPYFVVGAKGMKFDGKNPTWMFSYGGFEIPLVPAYSGSYEDLHGAYGKLWLERGGVFVLANIRGGGEFGPAWHTSALKENHIKAYDDFEAVARDLVARKITSAAHLGIEGRSNGGLLVGATMLRHPELYGAVVCGNPLLDMQRYHLLLAGASWMAEYGNPDVPAEWTYLSQYSPYQRLGAGLKLPPVMFYTSTRDDRVHPGHARKMAAKMEALGYPVEYFENTEGGHHGSVTNEQLATRLARTYAFLWEHLK